MPTYEYECTKCNLVFEHYQSMNDAPLETCTHPEGCCHPKAKAKVKRLIGTGAGLIFKGSGFYTTDYRSKDYHEAAKKEKDLPPSVSTPAASSESTKSESKASPENGKPAEKKK
jgi:putative FmdB family regulatory protein